MTTFVATFVTNQEISSKDLTENVFTWMNKDSNGYPNMQQFMRKKFLVAQDRLPAVRQHVTRVKQNISDFNTGSSNRRIENSLWLRNMEAEKKNK